MRDDSAPHRVTKDQGYPLIKQLTLFPSARVIDPYKQNKRRVKLKLTTASTNGRARISPPAVTCVVGINVQRVEVDEAAMLGGVDVTAASRATGPCDDH